MLALRLVAHCGIVIATYLRSWCRLVAGRAEVQVVRQDVVRRSMEGKRIMRRLACLFVLLALTAGTCGPAEDVNLVTSDRVTFDIEPSDAENFQIRFHPEDAARYALPETVGLAPNERTGRGTVAVIERSMPTPDVVCLVHNAYLEDLSAQLQTILVSPSECRLLTRTWRAEFAVWEPIPG